RQTAVEGVTILEVVPSVLQAHFGLDPAESPSLPALRWMLLTGEALPPMLCRRWLAHYPTIPLLNAYGPTECSDDVTHHVIAQPPSADLPRMPIGRPLLNMQLYVLD